MQKYILKQQFEGFSVSNSEGLHKGYDRFQSLLSQLKIHGVCVSTEGANQKFLRYLPSSWYQVSLNMRTKPGVDTFSFDDLYKNFRVFESDVKGSTASSSSTQNVAFVSSDSTNSTNEVDEFDLEEMDLKWHVAMISTRLKKFYKKTGRKLHFDAKEPVGFDKTKVKYFNCHNTGHFAREYKSKGNQESVDWTGHAKDDTKNYALMAFNSSNLGSDTEVTSCSKVCEESYAKLNKLYDEQRKQLGVASIEIQAYTLALKKMSTKDKSRLGYGTQINKGVLSYENEVLESVFDSRSSDVEDSLVNDIFAKVKGIHAVPPPMTGIYMPPKFNFGIDESKFTYGPKQSKTSESDVKTNILTLVNLILVYKHLKLCLNQLNLNPKLLVNLKFGLMLQSFRRKGIVDSGCSRHMTGNKAYLVEYQDFNGGPVGFRGSKGQITGKGKIRTRKLDFKDVYFVKELQHFNLFSMSQICDKKNKVLFTYNECLVLSPDFMLPDENQVLLRVPRQNNMYSFNLEKIISSRGLACLIEKATVDESNKWHNRMSTPVLLVIKESNTRPPVRPNYRPSDVENSPVNDRFAKVEGMHTVPSLMTRNYMPPKFDFGIDESKFTYGPKQSQTSESDVKTNNLDSYESNSSVEILESVPKPVESKPKAVSEPKVWSDAPIIEEYESDNDDEYVFKASVEQEKPTFAFINTVKHVKTHRQTVKDQDTCSRNPKIQKRDLTGLMSKRLGLGYGYTRKACFVCDSFSHLIRDCDFHEKRMAKQVELNKRKKKVTCQRNDKPVWNNVQRLNHQNKFVPATILTKTGRFLINRVLVTKPQTKTSYELLTGKIPIISYIRPFGCHVTILNTIDHLGKFEEKSDEGFLVGYSLNSKAFRVYNLETKRVEENLHINFLENKPSVAGKGPTWLFNLDYLTDSMNHQHVIAENKANKTAGPKEANNSAENKANKTAGPKEANNSADANNEDLKLNEDTGLKINKEPVDLDDKAFLEELESLKRQENEVDDVAETLRNTFAQSTEDLLLQAGAARASSPNFVNTASTPVNTASLSRNSSDANNEDPKLNEDTGLKINKEPVDLDDKAFLEELESLKRQENKVDDVAETLRNTFAQSTEDLLLQAGAARASSPNFVNTASTPVNTASLSRNVTPKTLHLHAVKRIFRRLISWQCKKQTSAATSTTEAEYVAAASCCGQVLCFQNKMLDYGFNLMNTNIYMDNESTICIVKNPVFHSKTKHIEIRNHFIKDAYERKLIQGRKKAKTETNIEEGDFNKLDDLVDEGVDYVFNEGRSTDKIKVLNTEAEGVSVAGEILSAATLAVSTASVQPILLKCFENRVAKMVIGSLVVDLDLSRLATTLNSPDFVEANYQILESLLKERRRQIRNEDLRTELEYFSKDYDKEREMKPRPEPRREATPTLRLRSPRFADNEKELWDSRTR
nr:ribonuclease H-like domain-containing protein [Tanacetum cinerariifolium]